MAVAERVSTDRGEPLGGSVGYKVQFEGHFLLTRLFLENMKKTARKSIGYKPGSDLREIELESKQKYVISLNGNHEKQQNGTYNISVDSCNKSDLNSKISLITGEKQKTLEKDAGEKTIACLDKISNSNGSLSASKIRLNMHRIMQNNAAVFRTQGNT
ncbi:hypothetical protein L2E82_12649 [Cichorium intybus]|uniref:Uncharacterized protein n=1 Tax=Cichorium intybus TaxID=13427 RepID=A0ACB9GHS5_CICIN|nr:hypothetical protein L2E82_12649 [Cichorium intybus]